MANDCSKREGQVQKDMLKEQFSGRKDRVKRVAIVPLTLSTKARFVEENLALYNVLQVLDARQPLAER